MTAPTSVVRLSRYAGYGRPAAPVRLVHLGLGNFFRAHQAWYTDQAPDAGEWGIAAFTGHRPNVARALAPQDGLYTLIVRRAESDELQVIGSVSAVHAAEDATAWLDYLRSPQTAVITLTVTEAGYLRGSDGRLDLDRQSVRADVATLKQDPTARVTTAPGRLVAGLLARRAADAGPVTILPCDNLPGNGDVAAAAVRDLAGEVEPELLPWLDANVDFATCVVDRITPATTNADRDLVRERLHVEDVAPVSTEPFTEWIVKGNFPAGRPAWDRVGVRFVDDVAPFERRKLYLLNGSHSLMAYAGSIRGHETVAEAVADPEVRSWVEQWWDDAAPHVGLPAEDLTAYRAALIERYENPRIRHLLAQIAKDGSQKLPVRILPTLQAARAAGVMPGGAVVVVGAWIAHLRGTGAPVGDVQAEKWLLLAEGPAEAAVAAVLHALVPSLEDDPELRAAIVAVVRGFEHR